LALAALGTSSRAGALALHASSQPARPREAASGPAGDFVTLAFSTFAGGDIWAGNGDSIWRSDDGGGHWGTITPTNLIGDDATVRLSGFGSFGANDLWFSAIEAGDASGNGSRGFAIEHSSDGGRTWRWSALPSCASCSMSFSFLSPDEGFALGSDGELYKTRNAGENWAEVAPTTPTANPAVDFVSAREGWLTAGDALEETTDGGHTWRPVELPASGTSGAIPKDLSAPHFLSTDYGVVAGAFPGGTGVVYVTKDSGRNWAPEPAPVAPAGRSPGWYQAPSFGVTSAKLWSISSGLALYVTGNGGRTWARAPAPRTYGKGGPIRGFSMVTRSIGWLAAAATPCGSAPRDLCAVPVLLHTTDGGHSWQPVGEGCATCGAPAGTAPDVAVPDASGLANAVVPKAPTSLAVGPNGDLYISDPRRQEVLERLPNGKFEVAVGTGVAGWSGDGGPAAQAEVDYPTSLAVAPNGTLYFVQQASSSPDARSVVREVAPDGIVTTVVGAHPDCGAPGATSASIPAPDAEIDEPALAFGPGGHLYLSAVVCPNDRNLGPLMELMPGGQLVDAPEAAVIAKKVNCYGSGLAFSGSGAVYVACDSGGGHAKELLIVEPDGSTTTFPNAYPYDDYSGLATLPDGTIVAIDYLKVVEVSPTGLRTIVDLEPGAKDKYLGTFGGQYASMEPNGIAVDRNGDIYLASFSGYGNGTFTGIIEVHPNGGVQVLWRAPGAQ